MTWNRTPLAWSETRARIRADRARIEEILAGELGRPAVGLLHPSFVCAFLYRISNHLWRRGHRHAARLAWHLNFVLTGGDISEPADLGPGLVVVAPPGVALMAKAGRNLTVMPCAGLGGELGRREDVGAGPGVPVLGDDVILEPHCGVLGPVRIGSRVRIRSGVPVTRDVPDDTIVEGPAPKLIPRKGLA